MRSPWPRFASLAALLASTACTAHGVAGRDLAHGVPLAGSHLSGEIAGLSLRAVANSRTFTYAVALSSFPAAFAFSSLTASGFRLGIWQIDPTPRPLFDAAINGVQHDVEALSFSPDGELIATASRDGAVRLFTRGGAMARTVRLGRPLTALAWSPDGSSLAVGSAQGVVTLLQGSELNPRFEAHVHGDEIRALAFDREGRLFSGSWDKTIAQLRVGQAILEPIRVHPFELFVNDMTVDAAGDRLGVAFGEIKAERTYQIYRREKQGVEEPVREGNCAAMVDVGSGAILERHVLHKGVVATAGISPDGLSLVSGGWDHQLYLFSRGRPDPVSHQSFGWSVRRARFSGDGRYLAVGSWTPQTGLPDKDSDPAAVVYDVRYAVSRSLEP